MLGCSGELVKVNTCTVWAGLCVSASNLVCVHDQGINSMGLVASTTRQHVNHATSLSIQACLFCTFIAVHAFP